MERPHSSLSALAAVLWLALGVAGCSGESSRISVTASGHQAGNVPRHVLDNDPGTYWAVEGTEHWLRFDFGGLRSVAGLEIEFANSAGRSSYFQVETSIDGRRWQQIRLGQSAPAGTGPERFTFTPTAARYLRIVGHGNSADGWNRISRVSIQSEPSREAASTARSTGDGAWRHTLDGDLQTYWSAPADGDWIAYDLQQKIKVGAVDIAFIEPAGARTHLDIEASTDGTDWRLVDRISSNGSGAGLERFGFEPIETRHPRLVARGTTASAQTRLAQVRIRHATPRTPASVEGGAIPVWAEHFEGWRAGERWHGERYLEVRAGCGVDGGQCLRATYEPNEQGSPRIGIRPPLPRGREYTLSYDILFEQGFEWVRGGKLPGLGPAQWTVGCEPACAEGWSALVTWGQARPRVYTYLQERENRCGTTDEAAEARFTPGRYHAVSLYLRLNEPAAEANGVARLYVDGELVAARENARFRGTDAATADIQTLLFHTFFGGNGPSAAPSRTVYARFDNVTATPGHHVRLEPGR